MPQGKQHTPATVLPLNLSTGLEAPNKSPVKGTKVFRLFATERGEAGAWEVWNGLGFRSGNQSTYPSKQHFLGEFRQPN